MRRALPFAASLVALLPGAALAQACPLNTNSVTSPLAASVPAAGSVIATPGATAAAGGTGGASYLAQLQAQSYGPAAIQAANAAGVNPNALAAIGYAESGFQNVPTANGSSSATGPFQITTGTFNQFASQAGVSGASQTDPNAQAAVAPYILANYAQAVTTQTGEPATTLAAYGAYVFGPNAGGLIASAPDNAPLSGYVSAQALANNNLTGATVGQFRAQSSGRLGSAANQLVIGA